MAAGKGGGNFSIFQFFNIAAIQTLKTVIGKMKQN